MSAADTPSVSRRQFLAGCAGCAAAAAMPTVAEAESSSGEINSLGIGGVISPEGRASMAEVDRRFQQQQPQMQKTVRAVKDMGLDPSGGTPINGKFESAVSSMSNTRIVFPSNGRFLLSGQITAQPDGPIEIVGNGCSFVIPPDTEAKSFTFVLPGGSRINDIVIDQSAKGALQEFGVQSEGVVRADNVTIKGYAPAKPSVGPTGNGNSNVDAMFSPIARTENAVIRVTNFTAVGGTAAGTHDEQDLPESSPENTLGAPMGVWVGSQTKGTVQMVNPKLSGWSNGMYSGRTKGIVEVRGGTFVNNFNSQARVGGGSVVDGASMLLDDRQWSDKGPFKIGHQGVYAVRVDAKHGNLTDPATFKNLRVKAMSMREGASLFDWESKSGPGIVRNCHITNHLDRPVFLGETPSAPAATNILVDRCLIDGKSSAGVMEMHSREQSRIQRTCITLPGAGPGSINGAQIGPGVSFGPQCQTGSGLAAPKKVGSGGNLSALPAPNVSSGSARIASGRSRQAQKGGIIKAVVSAVFMIVGALVGVGMMAVAVAALIAGGAAVVSYLVIDQ